MGHVPVFLYDGKCGFCRMWLGYLQALVDGKVEFLASQEAGARFPQIPPERLKHAAALVENDNDKVLYGAAAIFSVLALAPGRGLLLWLYRHIAPFRWISDAAYRLIAAHRPLAYTLHRLAFGPAIRPLHYGLTEFLFLRALGIVFLFAFWSLQGQILALAGSHGIIPAAEILSSMRAGLGSRVFLLVPSIFWISAGDSWLKGACTAGMCASLFLFVSGRMALIWQRLAIGACFVLYLSLASIGQPFTMFQWDALLLEAAFLSIFAGTPMLAWAFRVLLFRLMFESGCVKLLSGDPTWHNLRALRFHFMTQPLPTPLAWYAYQSPGALLDALTFLTLAIELVCPWLLFLPRRIRHIGALVLIALQVVILLTGNYAFFNLLTIAICLWAFDDGSFRALKRFARVPASVSPGRSHKPASIVLAVLIFLGSMQVIGLFKRSIAAPFLNAASVIAPFQIVNSYGLFAVMTTARPEIVFEASEDGTTWREYSFRYKPGDVRRGLPIIAPFQPRLDWQLWFAALDGNFREDRWTVNLAARLLEAEPEVEHLLDSTPFSTPPKFVRASLYDYWFTTPAERKKTGAIWNRRYEREYLPAISLDMLKQR